MIVLDTNVISEAMKPAPNPAVRTWLNEQIAETLYLTSVTLAELLFGIAVLPAGRRKNTSTRALDGLLALFGDRVLPFDTDAARHHTVLAVAARNAGRGFQHRTATSPRSPPPGASSSRHATPRPTRRAGSGLSTRGKPDPATLPEPAWRGAGRGSGKSDPASQDVPSREPNAPGPNNQLEALKGNRAGQHSIRINRQWRICFVWTTGGPDRVEIVDDH
jgi:hypothetical protein